MKQTPARVPDLTPFVTALHLRPTIESVVEHNVARLHTSGQLVVTIKAIHTGPNAAKASSEDAGGLQPIIYLAHGARVMLTANLWVDKGLVNGSMGTVVHGHLLQQWWSYASPPNCRHGAVCCLPWSQTPRWNCSYHSHSSYLVCTRCFMKTPDSSPLKPHYHFVLPP